MILPPRRLLSRSRRFVPYPNDVPEIARHLRVLERVGIEPQGRHKELPVDDRDRRALTEIVPRHLPDSPYVVVHPGASVRSDAGRLSGSPQWPTRSPDKG